MGERNTGAGREAPLTELALNILISLGRGPLHGYGIIRDIEDRTGEPSGLRSGTLYAALQRLRSDGLIEPAADPGDEPGGGPPRKFFGLTEAGRRAAARELSRLRSLVADGAARRLIGAEGR